MTDPPAHLDDANPQSTINSATTVAQQHRGITVVAILLIAAAYFNALSGRWVYDDRFQIVENRLIQNPRLLPTALVSDVWAFHGQRDKPWSNYWRPVFILWLGLNYQLFGLWTPGWHFTNLLLHAVVTLLVIRLLYRLRAPPAVAALVAWVFAVHPVHVESVTWVSGVTDLLLACFLLSAYLLHGRPASQSARGMPIAACACYALALLSKEAAVIFPLIVFASHYIDHRDERVNPRAALRRSLSACLPYLLLAVVYVFVRFLVLGQMRTTAPGAPGWIGALATVPSLLVFYLRQTFWPLTLGPDNPWRPVTNSNIGLTNFILPLALLILLINVARPMIREQRLLAHGLLWFILPLALALDIRVFLPDQIVNNRYLYLSVLGGFLIVGQLIHAGLHALRVSERRIPSVILTIAVALSLGLIPLTHDYNKAWSDEIALWTRGAQTDPDSPHAYAQLGEALRQARRWDEAETALRQALVNDPDITTAHISLGILAIERGQYTVAEQRLRKVLDVFPDYAVALEQLAACYEKQNRHDDAIAVFRDGIERMPFHRSRYTLNIAVLHAMAGRLSAARDTLESVRAELERGDDPRLLIGWFYLGELHRQTGDPARAAAAYQEYLDRTSTIDTEEVRSLRVQCRDMLSALPR